MSAPDIERMAREYSETAGRYGSNGEAARCGYKAHYRATLDAVAADKARIAQLESAIRWALGYDEGAPQFGEQENQNRYGWRTELRRRAEPLGDVTDRWHPMSVPLANPIRPVLLIVPVLAAIHTPD